MTAELDALQCGKSETTQDDQPAKRRVLAVLLLGFLIRELFSFWTGHPSDFELWVRLGYAMNHGGNPYGVLPPVPGLSFADAFSYQNAPTIAYLPFWPLVTGLVYAVYSLVGFSDRFVYYFLLKQPVIAGDMALGYLLYFFVYIRKPERSMWVLLFWMLSPFTIILSGIWGMFDSIAMVFVMISIMSMNRMEGAFWTGFGIFAKSIPIIYAVPTVFRRRGNWPGLLLSIAVPALLSIATFAVMHWSLPTIEATLVSTARKGGESMSVWDSFFYLDSLGVLPPLAPSLYGILGLLWVPALVFFTGVALRRFRVDTENGLHQCLIVVTLVFLIFKAQVNEQYAIYLLALSALDVSVWNAERKQMLLATAILALIYLIINNYFLIKFLSPIYPQYALIESGLNDLIGPIRYAIKFVAGSIFTCLNIRYLITTLKHPA